MPSFSLSKIPKNSDFSAVAPVLFHGNTTPRNSTNEFIFPILTTSEAAIEDCRNRVSTITNQDPNTHYMQVVDDDADGRVVACSEVRIYENNETNPFFKGVFPDMERGIFWWPEGSDTRRFVARIFEAALGVNRVRKKRPHISINNITTSPPYRHQGAATILLNWIVKKADELGIECFVHAHITMGVPLYEKVGFIVVDRTMLDMEIENPSEEWKACQRQLGEQGWDNMWRPVGGKYVDGDKYPWEE